MDLFILFYILSFFSTSKFRFLRDIVFSSNRSFLSNYPEFDFSFSNITFEFVTSILSSFLSVVIFSASDKLQIVLYPNFFFSNPFHQNHFIDILVPLLSLNPFRYVFCNSNPFERNYMDRVAVEYKKKIIWDSCSVNKNKSISFNPVDNRNIVCCLKNSGFRFLKGCIIKSFDQKIYSDPNFSI